MSDEKVEPTIGDSDAPTIGRVNIGGPGPVNNNDGWLKYIIAANASGAGSAIAFALAAVLFFPIGYYTKWRQVRTESIAITLQAEAHEISDKESKSRAVDREAMLNGSLLEFFTKDEIQALRDGEKSKFDEFKEKFTEYLPGETEYLPGKPVYLPGKVEYFPRQDCGDDYLGDDVANKANEIISQGYSNRAANQ